jgi:hypothetical protein
MKRLEKFDEWVRQGPFTPRDLGIYRIIYSCCALLIVPDITWLAEYPDFMFHPPLGPFQLLPGFPSLTVLVGLEALRTVLLVLVGLGVWTRFVSIATAVVLVVTYGLTYCLGKIDHTVLLVVTPLILSFANWGDRLSVDALRGKQPQPQSQWPLRLLALAIALPFFAAAFAKLGTGWLLWSSQAAQGQFFAGFDALDRTSWLAPMAAQLKVPAAWEVLDWLTVIIESALLVTLPWWRAFRIALAFTVIFHLGVFLVMNINFATNIVVYGAFVPWAARLPAARVLLFAPLIAASARLLVPAEVSAAVILFVGAVFGVGYLADQLWSMRRLTRSEA